MAVVLVESNCGGKRSEKKAKIRTNGYRKRKKKKIRKKKIVNLRVKEKKREGRYTEKGEV